GDQEVGPVLGWIDQVMTTERLVGEIQDASQRIAELVGSIKSYTHMDQDQAQDRQWVDIKEGIYSTLTILKHKFKSNQIQLIKEIPPDLPKVFVYPGELNQVWTNLFDNALDAMPDGGTLTINITKDGPCLLIRIIDSGTGIPPEVLPRIFDPFYTTKAIGKGTGMGLDVVQKIILHHRASIEVDSEPGRTEFRIWLSLE
ncbi:MAG: HAMP domain-containing sensor histidine kinase, partial [Bacteroidota bacterium]